jgi:hypothetical protein
MLAGVACLRIEVQLGQLQQLVCKGSRVLILCLKHLQLLAGQDRWKPWMAALQLLPAYKPCTGITGNFAQLL